MKNVIDFLSAALPWISIGLLLAIFFARNAVKKKDDSKRKDNYANEGLALGMCFGTAIGTSFGSCTGIGLTLGMLIGFAIGMQIEKKDGENGNE